MHVKSLAQCTIKLAIVIIDTTREVEQMIILSLIPVLSFTRYVPWASYLTTLSLFPHLLNGDGTSSNLIELLEDK